MAKECENCAYKSDFKSPECGTCMVSYCDGEQLGLPSNFKQKPQTNADRIRAMTDEELADFLVVANPTNCLECAFSCGWRCQPDRQDYSDTEKCVEGKKRWLKQPAEGE